MASPSKRALVVGINTYENLSVFDHLEGCVNDARLIAGLLRDRFGFPEENVTLLTDETAARDGILGAMDALADATGPDDIVVMFFAGHGSQMTDREGDEPDGLDETIVPYDTGRAGLEGVEAHENRDITDDEINAWLLRVTEKTGFVTLIFDSCHSGTITRDTFGAKTRFLEPDLRPVEELPPSPLKGTTTRSAGATQEGGPSGWLPLGERYVLIAGCRDEESSHEHHDSENNAQHGALTFFLSRALADARPGTTYRDVYEQVRPSVTATYPKQHPQMEGALDREVFGVLDIEPMRFVGVAARDGLDVTLAGGAAHGLTVDSEWTIYPPGTKTTEGTEALGRIVITRVGAVASEAELVEEAEEGAVDTGARAVETLHAYGAAELRIDLTVPESYDEAKQALVAEIGESGLLRIVEGDERGDVRAYLIPPRPAGAHPVPQLGALVAATWAVVGTDGRLLMPVHRIDERDVARTLRENFDKVARYRYALALDNPDPDNPLRDALDLRIERQRADGTWVEATPDEPGGEVVFHEGDKIAFTITNTHTEPLYVYALDFGVGGAVSPLTMRGANEKLEPNKPLRVKELMSGSSSSEIVLNFPKRFPGTEGTETLKVFATTHETSFDAFVQTTTRSVGTEADGGTSLQQLIRRAGRGIPMRDMGGSDGGDDADWTAASRTFVLRRKTAALDDAGTALDLGSVTIRARGLDAEVRVLTPPTERARTRSAHAADPGDAHTPSALDAVLSGENVDTQQAVEISSARTRSLTVEPTIEVEVRAPGPEEGQFVLYTDESGVATWQFAETAGARTRGAGAPTRTYVIDRAAPVRGASATRGIAGAVGKKLIQVLVFPLIDPLIGRVGDYFAERWEEKKRPYGLRPFTPDDFHSPNAPALDGEAWRRLGAGRSLLLVHGTFSRAHSAFGGLAPETVAELYRRYDGRVFAFDHFTLSHDPKQNIAWLFEHLPADAALDLDIVCHSRGGLVSRVLAEQQSAFSLGARALKVGKVVFVASPNAGTSLADPEHMGALVDTYTNLLNFLPDNPVTDVLDGVVTVAKQLAVGALKGLDGLQSMRPGGDFQHWLNDAARQGDTRYFALGADFKPTQPGFAAWVKDRLMGRIFGAENDLVVPTASVYADSDGDGTDLVAEADRHIFPAEAAISHTGFFQHPAAQEKLLTWLQA